MELRDIRTEDLAVICTSAMIELIGGHTWKEYRREENMSMGLVEQHITGAEEGTSKQSKLRG